MSFQEPDLSIISIGDQVAISIPLKREFSTFHHSSTPLLLEVFKLQETKSPLGITKAGSSGPGFLCVLCASVAI